MEKLPFYNATDKPVVRYALHTSAPERGYRHLFIHVFIVMPGMRLYRPSIKVDMQSDDNNSRSEYFTPMSESELDVLALLGHTDKEWDGWQGWYGLNVSLEIDEMPLHDAAEVSMYLRAQNDVLKRLRQYRSLRHWSGAEQRKEMRKFWSHVTKNLQTDHELITLERERYGLGVLESV